MLGYISSTRKKSCRQCVKAKRRCDLGFPCCKRCFTKGLDCAYPNAAVREAEVVIRQTTPDLPPLSNEVVLPTTELPPDPSQIDPALLRSSDSSSPESHEGASDQICRAQDTELRMVRELMPQIWAPSYLSDEQVMFLIGRIRDFVPALAHTGHNIFIHEALYRNNQPAAFEDAMGLSALYMAKTKQNIPILTKSIDNKISTLLASSHGWPLTEHLAAVQALIIYQIMRLFDPELRQQEQADRQNRLLEVWAAHLWKRSFNELANFKTCWEAWIFYESVRRTVLMSVFIRGGWSAVTRGGLCDQVPVLSRLPLSKDDWLWSLDERTFGERAPGGDKDRLVAYGDFSLLWKPADDDPSQLTDFKRLLLAPCRGDDPRLLS